MEQIEFTEQDTLSKSYPTAMPKKSMQSFLIKIGLVKSEKSATAVLLLASLIMLVASACVFVTTTNPNALRMKKPTGDNTSGKTFQDFLKERQANRNQP